MNKGKNTRQGNMRRRKQDWNPNKRPHSKVQNAQRGALRGENTIPYLGPKLSINSTKQVV
jgi:hypothetical protein